MSVTEARRSLHALIRETRKQGGEVTLTARGEPVAKLVVTKEPPRLDWAAMRRGLEEAYEADPALAREAEAFHRFMEYLVAHRGVRNWLERIEDPSDPELV